MAKEGPSNICPMYVMPAIISRARAILRTCNNSKKQRNAIVRAKEHDEEQQELGNTRNLEAQQCKPGNLKCLLISACR